MRRFIPLIATLVVIAAIAAASILPINGVETGELSARYPTGFTPAGCAVAVVVTAVSLVRGRRYGQI